MAGFPEPRMTAIRVVPVKGKVKVETETALKINRAADSPIAVVVFTKIQPGSTALDAVKHWLATDRRRREITGKIRVGVYVA
jgi:hypothetical protein